jgi:hypothetical protein
MQEEPDMIIRYPKTPGAGSTGKDEQAAGQQEGADNDPCRCKEASKMSARELFKLMVSDLAFWQKMRPPKK